VIAAGITGGDDPTSPVIDLSVEELLAQRLIRSSLAA
jgi:hypothetical protein